MGERAPERAMSRSNTARRDAAVGASLGLALAAMIAGSAGGAIRPSAAHLTISASKSAKYGTVLASGTTLYTLKPGATPCAAACTKVWPEVLLPKGITKAVAGTGVSAAKLGTVRRAGGRLQVTYGGKALYFFTGDRAPGQVNGNFTDTWGTWSDVVLVKPASGGGGSTSTGTGGTAF